MKKFIIPFVISVPLFLSVPSFAASTSSSPLYNPELRTNNAYSTSYNSASKVGTEYAYWHYRHWHHRPWHRWHHHHYHWW